MKTCDKLGVSFRDYRRALGSRLDIPGAPPILPRMFRDYLGSRLDIPGAPPILPCQTPSASAPPSDRPAFCPCYGWTD